MAGLHSLKVMLFLVICDEHLIVFFATLFSAASLVCLGHASLNWWNLTTFQAICVVSAQRQLKTMRVTVHLVMTVTSPPDTVTIQL